METFTNKENKVQRESPLIFIVAGTQEPFDRMIKIIDKWADNQTDYTLIAQTAKTKIEAKNIKCYDFLEPVKFDEIFKSADFIIGHAGMGTIINSLEHKKKIIVFPRYLKYKEHRNDHQHYTAKSFEELGYVNVAYTEGELIDYLNDLENLQGKNITSFNTDKSLIKCISSFLKLNKN